MAKRKDEDRDDAEQPHVETKEAESADSVNLGGHTYTHMGRQYTGVVKVGAGGPEAQEIEAEGLADLKKAVQRRKAIDEATEASKRAIDTREEKRRDRIREEEGEAR